jgi:hypothetical protein
LDTARRDGTKSGDDGTRVQPGRPGNMSAFRAGRVSSLDVEMTEFTVMNMSPEPLSNESSTAD